MEQFAFERGWFQLKQKNVAECRRKICAVLDITTRAAFYYRLHGTNPGRPSDREAIERIFNDYGITDIWGKA